MKVLERNKSPFYYSLYLGKLPVTDEDGNETGEYQVAYADPVKARASISAVTGYSQTEQFGNLTDYDKVIVTDDLDCPIDENTVLHIEVAPTEPYDYTVRRVAKSLNSISIAVSKVAVS